jgi:hypothetical protein
MRTDRLEASSLLRKWFDELTLLSCDVNFTSVVCSLKCRISSVEDEFVDAMSDDRQSVIRISLDRITEFSFGDSRVVPGETEDFKTALVMFFGASDDPDSELITFIERRDD